MNNETDETFRHTFRSASGEIFRAREGCNYDQALHELCLHLGTDEEEVLNGWIYTGWHLYT